MKKILLVLVLVIIPSLLFGQKTYIPDDFFEAYLEQANLGDNVSGNDSVLTSNISSITYLAMDGNDVTGDLSNLTGLQDFTSLDYLSLSSHDQLSNIDLTLNTSLTRLKLLLNNILYSVNVSSLSNLDTLEVEMNSNLHTLNLSSNSALIYANISYSHLSSLNLLNASSLKYINLSNNPYITSVDLTNVSSLEKVSVNSNVLLSSLILSGASSLTEIYCSQNLLTSLDVSSQTLLEILYCPDDLGTGNGISTLDLTNNILLQELNCNNNSITALDLSMCTNLIKLYAANTNLSSLDLRNITVSNISRMHAYNNSNLSCIDVDNPTSAYQLSDNPNNISNGTESDLYSWQVDDGTGFSQDCSTFSGDGCTDPNACNYNANAINDDGSCFYGNCVENITQNTFTAVIQVAIDNSVNGDTLIASSGTYLENINFNGKDIVLSSDFLLSNDTSYISSTIIDGNGTSNPLPVVEFKSSETNDAKLIGFTIQNGNVPEFGGGAGINIVNSSPHLDHLIIKNNISGDRAGGISLNYGTCLFSNLIIFNNSSSGWLSTGGFQRAGGIYVGNGGAVNLINSKLYSNSYGSAGSNGGSSAINTYNGTGSLTATNCLFFDNYSTNETTGAQVVNGDLTLINCSFYNNNGRLDFYGNSIMINSIVSSNHPITVSYSGGGTDILNLSYSLIEDGLNSITYPYSSSISLGNGNLFLNPVFTDTSSNNLSLSNFSLCIGAGLDTSIVPLTDIDTVAVFKFRVLKAVIE